MNFVKYNPIGIDAYIQQFQEYIYAHLTADSVWGADDKYDCYGRVYRNRSTDGYTAEFYSGDNYVDDDYKEVYWDDAKKAISFFGIGQTIEEKLECRADVHLVFFLDLKKIQYFYPNGNVIAHRPDEEARQQVRKIVEKGFYGFVYKSMELGIENVLRDYPGSRRDKRMAQMDVHPLHCFRFNFSLSYKQDKKFLTPKLK